MEKKFEITGPVGNADIQKRIRQLALAYALSPPENHALELAQWRTLAEFATEALRLSRVSNETGAWGPGLFSLGGTDIAKGQSKRPLRPKTEEGFARGRKLGPPARTAKKDAKVREVTTIIADLFKDPIKAKWTNEDFRDYVQKLFNQLPSFKGEKPWTPKTTLKNIKPIAKMLRNPRGNK